MPTVEDSEIINVQIHDVLNPEQNFKLPIIDILTDLIENENKLNKTIILYNTQINLDYMDLKKFNKFIKNDIIKHFNIYVYGNFKI